MQQLNYSSIKKTTDRLSNSNRTTTLQKCPTPQFYHSVTMKHIHFALISTTRDKLLFLAFQLKGKLNIDEYNNDNKAIVEIKFYFWL